MKKILAIMLAALMLFAFAACGGNNATDGNATDGNATTAAPATTATSDAGILFKYFILGQKITIKRLPIPTISAQILKLEKLCISASSFSMLSTGDSPFA